MGGQVPTDEELIGVMTSLPDLDAQLTRRITLLVYRDIEAAHKQLVEVFGFAAGPLVRGADGKAVHGEVYAGDGVIWMHREAPEFKLASPATLGAATHCMAVNVDDIDVQFARVKAAGGDITKETTVMPYGVREYSVRDCEGGLWSFMEPLREEVSDE